MKTRNIIITTVGAVAVTGAAIGLVSAMGETPLDPKVRYAAGGEVRRLSGDHLKLDDGRTVEFAAIRLPYEDEPYAAKSREVLARWLDDEGVRVQFDELRVDRNGRILAYVFANETFINERLVRDGLAFVKLRKGNRQHAEKLLAAQNEAMSEMLGIWRTIRPTDSGRFLGDEDGASFHRPDCAKAQEQGRTFREFTGTATAFDAGYAPCGKCGPWSR